MVRKAIAADAASIRVLMQSVQGFWQPWWSDKTIIEAILSANGLAFVWEDSSSIAGFVCAHDLGFRAYLSELVVDHRVRRQGVATRLLGAVEEALGNRDQRIMIADVWRDAEPFYKSRGWEPPEAVLLRRRLQAS
jgi:ribosomal protein S18 acetylase RimI-like enzyme